MMNNDIEEDQEKNKNIEKKSLINDNITELRI